MIKVDRTITGRTADGHIHEYAVACCTECPYWHAFGWSLLEARERAAQHEARVHPGQNAAKQAAEKLRRAARKR